MSDYLNVMFQSKYASPGDTVNCIIYLRISKTYKNAKLICKLKGKEKTGITVRSGEDGETTYYKDSKTIYKNEDTFLQGRIEAGDYQYPYSFVLPQNLPSSFYYHRRHGEYAEISYEVKVKFGGGDGGWFKSEFKLKQKDDIYVVQVYPPDFRQNYRKKKIDMRGCCCVGKGKMEIEAGFEKTIYTPGEQARFHMKVDAGESLDDVQDVQGQCNRWITVRCRGRTEVWKDKVDRVSGGSLAMGQKSGTYLMTPTINANQQTMTTLGSLVKCEYYLSAVARMGFCCNCQENPAVRLPILVCQFPTPQQQMAMLKVMQLPMGWNPQTMQPRVANLAINNTSQYPNYYGNNGGVGGMGGGLQPPPLDYMPVVNTGRSGNGMNGGMGGANPDTNKPINPREILNLNYPQSPNFVQNGGGAGTGGLNGNNQGIAGPRKKAWVDQQYNNGQGPGQAPGFNANQPHAPGYQT